MPRRWARKIDQGVNAVEEIPNSKTTRTRRTPIFACREYNGLFGTTEPEEVLEPADSNPQRETLPGLELTHLHPLLPLIPLHLH